MTDLIRPVQLPAELDGTPLVWGDWELAPIMSHIPFDCEHCAFDGEPAVAVAISPDRKGRWTAVRCRCCQSTSVTTFRAVPGSRGGYERVWSAPPQPYRPDVPVNPTPTDHA